MVAEGISVVVKGVSVVVVGFRVDNELSVLCSESVENGSNMLLSIGIYSEGICVGSTLGSIDGDTVGSTEGDSDGE